MEESFELQKLKELDQLIQLCHPTRLSSGESGGLPQNLIPQHLPLLPGGTSASEASGTSGQLDQQVCSSSSRWGTSLNAASPSPHTMVSAALLLEADGALLQGGALIFSVKHALWSVCSSAMGLSKRLQPGWAVSPCHRASVPCKAICRSKLGITAVEKTFWLMHDAGGFVCCTGDRFP